MIAGTAAAQVCFQLGSSVHSLLPSDVDSAAQQPAVGAPNVLARIATSASLQIWKFHVDFVTPGNSTLAGPTTIPVASYTRACNSGACVPQAGTSQKLDSLADRAMYRFSYRNFGLYESWLLTHSVATGRKVNVAAAEQMIPCVLELGGKDPAIVLPDADLDSAAAKVAWGAFAGTVV